MKLRQFLEGNPKILQTKYDGDKEVFADPELEAVKKKISKAKTFDEIAALLSQAQPKKPGAPQ